MSPEFFDKTNLITTLKAWHDMTDLPLGRWLDRDLLKFFQTIVSNSACKALNSLKVSYSYAYSSNFTVLPLSCLTRDPVLCA